MLPWGHNDHSVENELENASRRLLNMQTWILWRNSFYIVCRCHTQYSYSQLFVVTRNFFKTLLWYRTFQKNILILKFTHLPPESNFKKKKNFLNRAVWYVWKRRNFQIIHFGSKITIVLIIQLFYNIIFLFIPDPTKIWHNFGTKNN